MRRPRGFTLVELLIVVTIIAVISAIMVPALLKSRPRANERIPFGGKLAEVRRSFDNLSPARVIWNPPLSMRQGESVPVEARITLDPTQRAYLQNLLGDGPLQMWSTHLTPVVSVKMASFPSDAFEIHPLVDDAQSLPASSFVRWVWDVKPLRGGDFDLLLNISLVAGTSNGRDVTRALPLPPRRVHVTVNQAMTAREWLAEHIEFVIVAIVIPLGAAIIRWLRRRRRRGAGF